MDGILERLVRGERLPERVVLVVAHPDDETLALASRMNRMDDLCIVHLTDGSPRDMQDARRVGAETVEEYAELRRQELRAAMAVLDATPELRCCWHPDKEAILHGAAIVEQLVRYLWDAEVVVTHSYEHGHPDHDTAALCVALACRHLEAQGRPAPRHLEFPSYHLRDGRTVFGSFWTDPNAPEVKIPLSPEDQDRRRRSLACFESQMGFLNQVPHWEEWLRPAPAYDFRAPAPPGSALYDGWGWNMTLTEWRRHADTLLDQASP
ncbi:PIG-L family deacetylase [Rubellimicrobium rubrum]|uniref:PIG-L family deacetylase n=1 Tax=Rubellimicrobium rubrum TaxID=2585369 RepID=A0A5C4MRR6_9RHOB|nr:PIG-L family deacetylase [Rubellimicrobium rubrum]TNC48481.1 PIG-L family deacetylase [Rubellimicrobium rubrum]